MKKLRNIRVFIVLLVSVLLFGCATIFVDGKGKELPSSLGYSVQVVEATQTVYDTALSIAGDLHCNGKITDEKAMKIVSVGNTVYMAINTSQAAIDTWFVAIDSKTDTEAAKKFTYMQLVNLSKKVMALANDYKEVTGKKLIIPSVILESKIVEMFGGQ